MPRAHQGSSSPHALVLAADREPWEQQPGEPNGSFGRFCEFVKCHPCVRKDMRRVLEQLHKVGDDLTSVGALKNMATLNLWHDRAAAYDKHQRQRAEQDAQVANQKWADKVAQRRAEVQLEQLEDSREMRRLGMAALRARLPEDISDPAALRMVVEGVRMERELLDLDRPTKAETEHPDYVDNMSQDEVAARLAELVDEVTRRVNTPPAYRTQNPTAAAASDVVDAEIISDGDTSDPPEPRPGSVPGPVHPPGAGTAGPAERTAIGPAEPS